MDQTTSPTPLTIPNTNAKTQILQLGAEHLNKCYQCGTCSVVCPLTPDQNAFPRKEMAWAQWGLSTKLLEDGDVWLCYQCNECSTHCPRSAMPGDLMAAVRNFQIEHYAFPKWMGKATSGLKLLPLALMPPTVLTALMFVAAVIIPKGGIEFPDSAALQQEFGKSILFERFLPHIYIDVFSLIAVGFAVVVSAVIGRRFWLAINRSQPGPPQRSFWYSLVATLGDIATHRFFRLCRANKPRGHAHMAVFYGFMLLVVATTLAFVYTQFLDRELSLSITSPVKLAGNTGGVLLLLGLTWLVWRRLARPEQAGSSGYFDWYFVGILYAATITGFAVEFIRFADLRVSAYSMYLVHLVFYFMLFTYLPFTKFAHIIYRTLALTHAKRIGRSPGTKSPVRTGNPELVTAHSDPQPDNADR